MFLTAVRHEVNNLESSVVVQKLELAINQVYVYMIPLENWVLTHSPKAHKEGDFYIYSCYSLNGKNVFDKPKFVHF